MVSSSSKGNFLLNSNRPGTENNHGSAEDEITCENG